MANGRRWTGEEKQRAFELLAEGWTYQEIGDELNRSAMGVNLMCNRNGHFSPQEFEAQRKSRGAKIDFTDEEIGMIRRDYNKKILTVAEICKKYHISSRVLKRLKKEYRFKRRTHGPIRGRNMRKTLPFSELSQVYLNECLTFEQIQEHFGVGRVIVRNSIETHGLDYLTQRERIKIRDEFEDRDSVPKKGIKEHV